MKNIARLLIALLLLHSISYAQDTIVKKSGMPIICIIQKVESDHIKYKNVGHENGPTFSIWKDRVVRINYANGPTISMVDEIKSFEVDTAQTIECVNRYFGSKINQSNRDLRRKEVKVLFENHPELFKKYKSGRRLITIGTLMALPCAFVFGYEVGKTISYQKSEAGLLIASGTGVALGLIMNHSGNRTIVQLVNHYNDQLQEKPTALLDFRLTEHGVGLCLSF